MKQVFAALLISVPLSAGAQAARTVEWKDGIAIPIRTALGITTQVALPVNEEILDYSVGFAQAWDVVRRDQVIYLKPREQDGETNLLVRTRERQYMFELTVHRGTWNQLADLQKTGVSYRVDVAGPVMRPAASAETDVPGPPDA